MSLFSKKEKIELKIEGMKCPKCSAHAEEALNAVPGVKAKVDLEKKTAVVTLSKPVEREVLVNAIKEAGYTVAE